MPDLAVLDETTWFALEGEQAADLLEADPAAGLNTKEASVRLQAFGPNELTAEPPTSKLEIAKNQIVDPTNLMLIGVAVVSIIIVVAKSVS
jgi:Ca2+-transporting ATPase